MFCILAEGNKKSPEPLEKVKFGGNEVENRGTSKIVPLHKVRKQATLVARCSNKFGISLVCTAFAYRKSGVLLDGKATSKRAGRCLHMHAASESGFVKQTMFFPDHRERTLERQNGGFFYLRSDLIK